MSQTVDNELIEELGDICEILRTAATRKWTSCQGWRLDAAADYIDVALHEENEADEPPEGGQSDA